MKKRTQPKATDKSPASTTKGKKASGKSDGTKKKVASAGSSRKETKKKAAIKKASKKAAKLPFGIAGEPAPVTGVALGSGAAPPVFEVATGAGPTRVTAVQLQVVVNQEWKTPSRTDEIVVRAVDAANKLYSYAYDPLHPDLATAKAIFASIAASNVNVPWDFLAIGSHIVG